MAPQLRVHCFSISLDGYGAGPAQTVEEPLGNRGEELHEWIFPTRTFRRMVGDPQAEEGTTGVDDAWVGRGFDGVGATVMGRNMFGPVRGEWPDDSWTGWWGPNPPYHHPVFVLTQHPRDSVAMEGGTTFHFVTDGIESALQQAFDAAGGRDVRLGGGVSTIQQYMRAGLVDYLHLAVVPLLLGAGERLLDVAGVDEKYACTFTPSASVVHAELTLRVN